MPIHPLAFATPVDAPRWKRWLWYSPAARIVIFFLLYSTLGSVLNGLMLVLGWNTHDAAPFERRLVYAIFSGFVPLIAYLALLKFVERRSPAELALRRLAPDGALGLLVGAALFSLLIGLLWLSGSYHVFGSDARAEWPGIIVQWLLGAALGEEIISRGVLFRIVEEGLGTWLALAVTAGFFAAMHLSNPGMSPLSAAALVVYGVGYGLIYHLTRSLYVCIGVHGAWNFMESAIYGVADSGVAAHGWLSSSLSGPTWLSGGTFGPEASLVSIAIWLVVVALLLIAALRRGDIVPPVWH